MTDTLVLGAGMVGVATALALQSRGEDVVLVDRKGIGRETSYGNAGAIQTEAVEPYAFPRDLRTLIGVALQRDNAVNWHLADMPKFVRPLHDYWRHSAPNLHLRATEIFRELVGKAEQFHSPLIAAAGVEDLIRREGYHVILRSAKQMDKAAADAERLKSRWGVAARVVDGAEIAALEPHMRIRMAGGVHFTDVWTCRSPGGLTAAYGRLFLARGGRFEYGDAQSLTADGAGWQVHTEIGPVGAARAVLALGPWSVQVTRRLGYRIPMFTKRGYHRHFQSGEGPLHPLFDAERATFISPMNQGVRIATGAEFTRMDADIDLRQIHRAEQALRTLFEVGAPIEADPWFGHRPCLPDMLPVLGEAPRHPGLWFHFGHAHQGFTAGPSSAHLLAERIYGRRDALTDALDPRRFE